jgi:DNA-binding HxlR family transcriptional regulator
MQTYGQYCPVARGAEIFATRWTPIIVRNLLLGCETFGEIHAGAPGIPRSLLTERLTMLERHGLIERSPNPHGRGSRYTLTQMGLELGEVCDALGSWGARWLETAPEQRAPYATLWGLRVALANRELPEHRIVVRFDISECEERRFWLVVAPPTPELCIKFPGYEEDLLVATNPATLAKWHTGELNLGQAIHSGGMQVTGRRDLIRTLAGWGGLSRYSHVPPPSNGRPSRSGRPANPNARPWPAATRAAGSMARPWLQHSASQSKS